MGNQPLGNDSNFSGIFINEATIKAAFSGSNKYLYQSGVEVSDDGKTLMGADAPANDGSKVTDIAIVFQLDIGKEFFPLEKVGGNLNPEKSGWSGGAMKVKIFLSDMRVKWTTLGPNNEIPQDVLDQFVGKKIMRLQYPYKKNDDGKNMYRSYSRYVLADFKSKDGKDARTFLREKYEADVAAGYVKPLVDEAVDFVPDPHDEPKSATF